MAIPAAKTMTVVSGAVQLTTRDGGVTMLHSRPLRTHAELDELLPTLERLLAATSSKGLLIDTRGCAERSPEDVGKRMMEWCKTSASVDRVAMLLSDDMHRVMATMRGLAEGTRFRGFVDEREARRWLDGKPSTR